MKDDKIINANIKDLVFDDKNANKHTEDGMRVLEKSITNLGLGRSILVDKDNRIIAGNGVTETAGSIGIEKVKIVETDGTEIIAVKRKDLSLDSKEGRELAVVDNYSAVLGINLDRQVLIELERDYEADFPKYELYTESVFADAYDYEQQELDTDKVKYPITIAVSRDDSINWNNIKEKIGIDNDKKAHDYLIKLCKGANLI